MNDILAKLFSSGTLVKVMRIFLFNQETPFDLDDITSRSYAKAEDARYEIALLESVGFLRKRTFYKKEEPKSKPKKSRKGHPVISKKKVSKKKVRGWILNQSFSYLPQLRALLVNKQLLDKKAMRTKLQNVGKVKLVLASGVFVQEPDSQLDLLIVADKVKPSALHDVVKGFEALIGVELRYALFGSDDFRYRLSVRDRLIRDVFDNPHTEVLNTYKNLTSP